jgi:nucleotide-binding universal stress UspA family protein
MSKPILVGYDPKTRDRAPVRFSVAAARFTGAPLIVACVCGRGLGRFEERFADSARAQLAELEAELESEDLSVNYRELAGVSAARVLHEAADEHGAGLLVVGSAAAGILGRVAPGSTAQRLMHGAPCPITIVPQGWEPRGGIGTIGVAYVNSDEAREALRGAHALAVRAGARLRVLTVHTPHLERYAETEPGTPIRPPKTADDVEGEHGVQAERALQATVAALGGEVPVEVDAFVEDDPAATLIRVSAHLDLLVCGSRGYGPLRAVLLGGVSGRVATAARCPVIVLPRGVPAPLEGLLTESAGSAAAG